MRKSLAASLIEICRLIGLNDDLDENDDRTFMVEVASQLLGDTEPKIQDDLASVSPLQFHHLD